jgi:glycyl-tRNA synthetase
MGQDVYERVFQVAKRRGFLYPAFEIYGGVAGFYDYGPLGAALKANMEELFRRVWVTEEGCAEINCPSVTPEDVFIASGHVAEFTDPMVTCTQCGSPYRADHLIEGTGYEGNVPVDDAKQIDTLIRETGAKCLRCGGAVGESYHQNLMFGTEIGPGTKRKGYLRPETAQGIFMDFPLLYRHFREKLPFGVIQFGRGYRNEISPRQGMVRLREFNMMEVEVFVDPEEGNKHPRFEEYADRVLTLVPAATEKSIDKTLRQALDETIIRNQALATYMAITLDYLLLVGLDPKRLRFRQHRNDEMAHYASDCWDAEFHSDRFGWVECVGLADRSAYDLTAHEKGSGMPMRAMRKYDEPREVTRKKVIAHGRSLGPLFKKQAKAVATALEALDPETAPTDGPLTFEVDGETVEVPAEAFSVETVTEKVSGESFTPHVIEPSFGLDRILYASLEHNFHEEEKTDEETGKKETYRRLALPAAAAPVKAAVFPLVSKSRLPEVAQQIERSLRRKGLPVVYDESGSIGRRYARQDEIGTPFCITVDFDTIGEGEVKSQEGTVTVRERDTSKQHRVRIEELPSWIKGRIEPRV